MVEVSSGVMEKKQSKFIKDEGISLVSTGRRMSCWTAVWCWGVFCSTHFCSCSHQQAKPPEHPGCFSVPTWSCDQGLEREMGGGICSHERVGVLFFFFCTGLLLLGVFIKIVAWTCHLPPLPQEEYAVVQVENNISFTYFLNQVLTCQMMTKCPPLTNWGNNCNLLESLGPVKPLAGRTTGVNGQVFVTD